MNRVPAVRFKGFTDPWEQRKLGDLASEFKSGEFISADRILESGPYPVYGGNGLRGYTTTYNHDGLYALIGRQGALCGNVNVADGKAYFTEHAVAVKANSLNDTLFLYYLFDTLNLGQYSGQSAQPGLAVSNLVEVETMVPARVEQAQIALTLSVLDSLITLHQRKHNQLTTLKKALLEKMFPKDGATEPEIRFSGFTDPWEQRKLGDLCTVIDTKHATAPVSDGQTRFRMIRTDCIRDGRLLSNNTDSVTEEIYEEWSERVHLQPGDLVFTREAPMGESAVIPDDGYRYFPGQRIVTLRSKGDADTSFLNDLIYAHAFRSEIRVRESASTTVANFGIPNIKSYEATLPSKIEQHQIGNLFASLDNLITLHQRKLELLRNLKAALLDKMFV